MSNLNDLPFFKRLHSGYTLFCPHLRLARTLFYASLDSGLLLRKSLRSAFSTGSAKISTSPEKRFRPVCRSSTLRHHGLHTLLPSSALSKNSVLCFAWFGFAPEEITPQCFQHRLRQDFHVAWETISPCLPKLNASSSRATHSFALICA